MARRGGGAVHADTQSVFAFNTGNIVVYTVQGGSCNTGNTDNAYCISNSVDIVRS